MTIGGRNLKLSRLSKEKLVEVLAEIHDALYLDHYLPGVLDFEKQWTSDTPASIATVFEGVGLADP